jgi:aryl-alcohol dehydrogenase-like predicted oxidoreductase
MQQTVQLGATGITLRPLGVGAMPWNKNTVQGAKTAFEASLDAGITLFDTAELYGRGLSEKILGRLVRRTQQPVIVASKFAPYPNRLRADSLASALTGSLRRLGLERVDLYQIHWPYTILRIEALMDALADEVNAGRVRAVGVSNYSEPQMRRAHAALASRGVPLASNQVQYSLLHRDPERNGVLDACRELNVSLIAYTPIGSGLLTGKYRPGGLRPSGYRRFSKRFRHLEELGPLIDALETMGVAHGRTAGQVALNWLARQEGVIPIPGAKDAAQATANAGALDFDISEAEAQRLDEVSAGLGA